MHVTVTSMALWFPCSLVLCMFTWKQGSLCSVRLIPKYIHTGLQLFCYLAEWRHASDLNNVYCVRFATSLSRITFQLNSTWCKVKLKEQWWLTYRFIQLPSNCSGSGLENSGWYFWKDNIPFLHFSFSRLGSTVVSQWFLNTVLDIWKDYVQSREHLNKENFFFFKQSIGQNPNKFRLA